MKTYKERTQDVLVKIAEKQMYQKRLRRGIIIGAVLLLAFVLLFPFGANPPSVRQYRDSSYYDLIQKLNVALFKKPEYTNLLDRILSNAGKAQPGNAVNSPLMDSITSNGTGSNYQEITDNQVAGIIEGDIIKRSDKKIYYLRKDCLSIYSINGVLSGLIGRYEFDTEIRNCYRKEIYLSEDCTTVTLVFSGSGDVLEPGKKAYFVCVVNLDVRYPANIRETKRVYLTGDYLSSRLVNGQLLVMADYATPKDPDYGNPETFVPRIGVRGEMKCIPAESIFVPNEPGSARYTMVALLDQKKLDVVDSAAILSYASDVYVNEDTIIITRNYTKSERTLLKNSRTAVMDTAAISYDVDGLEILGSTTVEGHVKDQYSMDEKDGILRVVTSTSKTTSTADEFFGTESFLPSNRVCNANLYCINLADWRILASVEAFAPDGEDAKSVRFDGDYVYVCTAEVITMTDPVYFFDLSDLNNITWKDTGTIDGYSSSLVNFGNGNLIGIGFNDQRGLKIEAYRETEAGVESICAYERNVSFSQDYKSYYIDRENQLIGMAIEERNSINERQYILLYFDGSEFQLLKEVPIKGNLYYIRGIPINDRLYVFGDEFRVVRIS